jgi:hypothetical protein
MEGEVVELEDDDDDMEEAAQVGPIFSIVF